MSAKKKKKDTQRYAAKEHAWDAQTHGQEEDLVLP
jgi:hypothetical protein